MSVLRIQFVSRRSEAFPAVIRRALALAAVLATAAPPAVVLAEAAPSGSSEPMPAAVVAASQTEAANGWPSDSSPALVPPRSAPAPGCDAQSIISTPVPAGETGITCAAPDLERDQAYLVETARPGGTMLRQGPALAITRLHPVFVSRLAEAIREARDAGLPGAGIFSAYRPPAFGVGGFADKFNSLHSYGLAVDMLGIGGPGSKEAKLWHEIGARHGIVCPYGAGNRREWNHCQPTQVKIILTGNPLRDTVSPLGPLDLKTMFAVGDALVSEADDGAGSPNRQPVRDQAGAGRGERQPQRSAGRGQSIPTGHNKADRIHERHSPARPVAGLVANRSLYAADGHPNLRIMREVSAPDNPPAASSRCRRLHNHRRDLCGALVENASGKSRSLRKYRTSSLVRRETRMR
jgi:hypothetical protein